MKEIYKDVVRLNKLDPTTPLFRLCKLSEEFGELAQAVNKKLGRKVVKESDEAVIDLIIEESADTLQCLFSYLSEVDIVTIDTFKDEIKIPSRIILFEFDPATELIKLQIDIGRLSEHFLKKDGPFFKFRDETIIKINEIIERVYSLAGFYDIKPQLITNYILVKNQKWEKVVKERNNG